MRFEILISAVIFFGGTFLSGYSVRRVLRVQGQGLFSAVVAGIISWWAVMELLLVPMTMQRADFQTFVCLYSVMIICMMSAGMCCWREILKELRSLWHEGRKYLTPGHVLALLLICYQLVYIHHHMYLEWDDTYYVNLANEAILSDKIYWVYPETGTLADFDKRYVLSLWPIFYAWLSRLISISPTIMAHTIIPWLMIPLAYMVYHLISKMCFPGDYWMQGRFLTFAVLLHLFMSGEHTTGITFLSITPWVGKGVLAAVWIPLLFYLILRCVDDRGDGNWILLGIACTGGCLLSSMGIMLIPVFVGISVLCASIAKRSPGYLLYGMLSCFPCILLGIYYIYLTH